jgi:hypothetical protein
MPVLPPARDFVTSAGFGGAAALLAALIVAGVVLLVVRRASQRHRMELEQQERQHRQRRDDELRAAALARCWQRLVWLVETAGLEPATSENATLGLGPDLALEMLRGLLRDAEQLGDDTLAKAASVYLGQFSLVLAQQGSLLSELAAPGSSGNGQEEQAAAAEPAAAAPTPDNRAAPARRPAARRRRRQ